MSARLKAVVLTTGALIAVIAATGTAVARQLRVFSIPQPRPLGPVVARSTQTFQGVTRLLVVRGALFINEAPARRLWMLDSALANGRLVLDSARVPSHANWYGPGSALGGLHRFRGDSVLFQPQALGGVPGTHGTILGPDGAVVRIALVPQRDYVGCDVGDMDNTGWQSCEMPLALAWDPPVTAGDSVTTVGRSDSAAVLAVSFKSWDVDTIARVAIAPQIQMTIDYPGRAAERSAAIQPVVPPFDAWTMFSDGTLAIARAADYHIEFMTPQRAVTNGPRAPFDWRRITDADKDRLLDSLRIADSTAQRVAPQEWPAYWPPFKPSHASPTVMVDADDRLWVDERQPLSGDTVSVYGIFDRNGQFLERIKVPASETIVGFGPGGMVYLTTIDSGRATVLKARFR